MKIFVNIGLIAFVPVFFPQVGRPQSMIATDASSRCSRATNHFDKIESFVKSLCYYSDRIVLGNTCSKFVTDYFNIATPYCSQTADPNNKSQSCEMFGDYFKEQFHGKNARFYLAAVKRMDALIDKFLVEPISPKDPKSIFDIALQATEGNKTMAITILAAFPLQADGEIGNIFAGWAGLDLRKLHGAIDVKVSLQGDGKFARLVKRDAAFSLLPSGYRAEGLPEEKPYHFWSRALLSRLLLQSGHDKWTAIYSSYASQVAYKMIGLNMKDFVIPGPYQKQIFRDLEVAKAGARFGVEGNDPPEIRMP